VSGDHRARRAARGVAALALLTLPWLGGCAPTLPRMPEPIDCPVSEAVLAQRCADPLPLADGVTYGDVIAAAIDDRKALRACSAHDRLLVQTLQECRAAIDRYRAQIRGINESFGGKP
jgi:hypothetical protein